MQHKITLQESEMPAAYYNILADLPNPLDPPLDPVTRLPIGPEALTPVFPQSLIKQEMSAERFIEIPDDVRKAYALYRPTPLFRARRFEKALDTPAKIYYKYEGVSPAGSHKLNTAFAQAFYNKQEGVKRLATETGAGQWGSSLSFACRYFGLNCKVYMVRVSYDQKPYRRSMMRAWGSDVVASPSAGTRTGQALLAGNPGSAGSLGIAISEAVEDAVSRGDTRYALGSVLNHVLLHQTIMGLEVKKQLEKAGDYPDLLIGCVGGGSNFGGLVLPFMKEQFEGKRLRAIAVEPASCPTLTKGVYRYDYGDTARMTPLLPMYTLGCDFMPPAIHAGGLRYHGMAPVISRLYKEGYIEAQAYEQQEVFDAGVLFAGSEGIIPAPEAAHAVKAVIEEASRARIEGRKLTIVFSLSGHGYFDMGAYDAFLDGKLKNNGPQ